MNLGKMMKKAKEMQENMQGLQEELAKIEVQGESGGGMVKVTMSGDRQVKKITIEDELWADQDKGLIEDLVAAAINAASQVAESKAKEEQQKLMSGLPLPPGFSL
ncbi:MAG: YbaB/EbfC family nucleoid-associated protein [Zetaproteobacteria bacterium]|nr:YbaB/EbfC family nucleoid-associated protein [Zetaproteobacteria bacterium]